MHQDKGYIRTDISELDTNKKVQNPELLIED